jgi:site-specific DNA-methyltransferase (adenine-specific)
MHRLLHGEAAEACRRLPAAARFHLVYLDPPFAGGGTMAAREGRGQMRGRVRGGRAAYADPSDPEQLVALLEPVLAGVRARLADRGVLYLHLDHRAVHEAKIACDRIFGRRAFAGEIVWAPGNGARGARGFSVTHQTILFYAREDRRQALFRADHPLLREPYADTSLAMHFQATDADGRRYRERRIGKKSYRYYADEGRRLGSVWTDLPAMVANTPLRREGTGYPTQKPERLLERIVRASSEEGDTVADLMCGSGTTLVVAARLGRTFVGCDRSPVAIDHTRRRLDGAEVRYRFQRLDGDAVVAGGGLTDG